ncbi:MAG: Gfo/Idh/MocA family oxidoreductase, partial [Chitinophagales bacterium]
MPVETLNIGIAGAGGFARFAATAFLEVPGIKIVAVADIDASAAKQMSTALNADAYVAYDLFLKNAAVEMVYIATPPYLHYTQSKLALLAGKHLICEKPAALKVAEAEELAALANDLQLLYAVNLMQRYNPIYSIVKSMIDQKLLGNFLHGFFENYASDEFLPEDHWFWDESKSGGIFIEHGVHFFDMFSGWLGEGKVLNALQLQRPSVKRKLIDRVQATVLYKEGVVNFYHGFDQTKLLDRQEMRLQFERGDVTLYGWIPVSMKLNGLLSEEQLEIISILLKDSLMELHNERQASSQKVRGRFSEILFKDLVTIRYGNLSDKEKRYQEMLIAMITDQWTWIRDRSHVRVIDERNAIQSLSM